MAEHKEACSRGELEKSAIAEHAWQNHRPIDDRGSRRMELEALHIGLTPSEDCHVIFGPVIFCPEGRNMIAIFGPDKI